MRRLAAVLFVFAAGCHRSPFDRTSGKIQLAAGVTEITAPLRIAAGAHDLEIAGDPGGSTIRMAANFAGAAAIVGDNVANVTIHGIRIEGSRTSLGSDRYLPGSDQPFADYYDANGILFRNSRNIAIRDVTIEKIKSFPILVNQSTGVTIENVAIANSGTLNKAGRSNTTGGILLEEGTTEFAVRRCRIHDITGNGIWTHAYYHSPRNVDGVIESNEVSATPRDAIQVGHGRHVRVAGNHGSRIGYPPDEIDTAALATPVALDSAGDVTGSVYTDNHFIDVNGQCIDLDGFHDGEVSGNSCINRQPIEAYPFLHEGIVFGNTFPDQTPGRVLVKGNVIDGFGYGGVYLIGEGSEIVDNRFVNINMSHCTGRAGNARCNYALDEPGMLRSGIYLATHAARPAQTRGNVIERNYISGFGSKQWCIEPAASIALNDVGENTCIDQK
ncbi:MAG TPA: right-handed parallel beta-helix repeat-containing protein [Bryobacteraceae bacterium]|nr:right-handed parallel beta-helix repeat-containing protein [Bryobacteraceae bacterium]